MMRPQNRTKTAMPVITVILAVTGVLLLTVAVSRVMIQEKPENSETAVKTIHAYGADIKVPSDMTETDREKDENIEWVSYVSENEKEYLIIQRTTGNVRDEMMTYIYPDGISVKMNGDIRETEISGLKGYEAHYLRDGEKFTCIGFKEGKKTILIDYNSAGRLKSLKEAVTRRK